MAIRTKFGLGDKVWRIEDEHDCRNTGKICPVCNGTGQVNIGDNVLRECRMHCANGEVKCIDGQLYAVEEVTVVKEGCVTSISTEGANTVNYDLDGLIWSYSEDDLFATKAEAEAELQNRCKA